ncbi:PREDICTED: protein STRICTOSIDINE SYNTHASE-LIKE 10-like [Camelina sativa]|uniref:Protein STRICTOSIDINE SYNTHASE-LIKE 10-like n=1 Tax=Camelina sativa TaxID=90675 RepID=A0ABM0SKF7_CAMSA|nr:PREDICTED: protein STRICTOSIDINE SYNTHASE-LIKE 10-like [Camelina sativa]
MTDIARKQYLITSSYSLSKGNFILLYKKIISLQSITMMLVTVFLTVVVSILTILVSTCQTGYGTFVPPKIPASRDVFSLAKVVNLAGASGPESIAFDPAGEGPYVGVADGRVLKWRGKSLGWTDFAYTSANRQFCVRPFAPLLEPVCGRPLGLRFHKKTGDLYIADAYFGLLIVGPAGGLAKPLVTEAEGQPFRFTNDLDIDDQNDVIYFTDASSKFQRWEYIGSFLTGDKTGRFMKYDRSSKKATVLLHGLSFANGVALSKDQSFVLVAETTNCKILRLWLSGPKAGTQDVFVVLPGYPDNIRRNSKGEFWVALNSLFNEEIRYTKAVKLSESGKILEVLGDKAKRLRFISDVEEKDGKLWIGSSVAPFVGVYDL